MEALVIGLVAIIAIGFAMFSQQRWVETLRAVAGLYPDLTLTKGGIFTSPEVVGSIEGHPVTVDTFTERHGKSSTTYTRVTVGSGLPASMKIGQEGFGSSIAKAFVGEDVQLGDPGFDASVVLRGDEPAELVAFLDAKTRAALRHAVEAHDARLDGGDLVLTVTGHAKVPAIELMLETALDVARAIHARRGTVPERLERIAFDDPEPGVRRQAFGHLLTRVSQPDARRVGRRAVATNEPLMVVAGARLLRDEASIAAVQAVVSDPHGDDVAAHDALELLFELGRPPALDATLEHSRRLPPVRTLAARCLGLIGGGQAQGRLITLLDDGDQGVAVAAAEALGRCGDIAAVEPLLGHTKGFGRGDLKRAAKDAIAAIQDRAAGEAGGLSLVEDAGAGGLSIASDAAGGRVSVSVEAAEEA